MKVVIVKMMKMIQLHADTDMLLRFEMRAAQSQFALFDSL